MVKETKLAFLWTKSQRTGLGKFTCAGERRKNDKESISQHFLLITAGESWMLKFPSGITPFLNCTSVPRDWQGPILSMSSPWITSFDWIISEHPMPAKASLYERQSWGLIYVHITAVRATQDPEPSAATCASLYDLTRSRLYHSFKSCGIQSFHTDLVKAPSCPHTPPSVCIEKLQPFCISSYLPPKPWDIHNTGVLCIISLSNTSECLDL